MAQCFNPECSYHNPSPQQLFCQKCGQKLLLTERYRGNKYLGEGGFGRTFIGIDHNRRNSSCVIKQFLPSQQGSGALQKCIQLFEQEAELLEKLGKHPQIPDLLAFFEQDGKLYLIQEYIEGENLLDEWERQGRFNESKVKTFLVEMLPVLDFIHKKSVIHRDIKPENIIRRRNKLDPSIHGQMSDLVLIDFGVSKQVSSTVMTRLGTSVGTQAYAAPEQSRGMVHFSSDIYSLAVTAIRLLTGVFPEERNGSVHDDIFDINTFSWVWKEWLSKNGLSVSKDLAQVLDKMMANLIVDRFQSAQDVLTALNAGGGGKVPKTPLNAPSGGGGGKVIKLKTPRADFTQLDRFLAQGEWKKADEETGKVMLKIMNRESEGWLTVEDCRNFPREELKIIDDLWVKYSDGKFGFSVQKEIYKKWGGTPGEYNSGAWGKLAEEVGWKKGGGGDWLSYSEYTFSKTGPKGHLPGVGGVVGRVSLFSRLDYNT